VSRGVDRQVERPAVVTLVSIDVVVAKDDLLPNHFEQLQVSFEVFHSFGMKSWKRLHNQISLVNNNQTLEIRVRERDLMKNYTRMTFG